MRGEGKMERKRGSGMRDGVLCGPVAMCGTVGRIGVILYT